MLYIGFVVLALPFLFSGMRKFVKQLLGKWVMRVGSIGLCVGDRHYSLTSSFMLQKLRVHYVKLRV